MEVKDQSFAPPRWTIDLSLPPRDRYREVARAYKERVQGLTGLYDALLRDIGLPENWTVTVNKLSRLVLRGVNDPIQTQELKGISEETGIAMYLLVAFNVLLDLLMGCTSGGVRCLVKGRPFTESKMLHFRTLDWTMDPLRQIVVQLDYIRSKSSAPQTILASSITYVGFVGVLTGVRKDLSMSLNFRAVHDASTQTAQFRFYLHHLLVLLGMRPSITTIMRQFLVGDGKQDEKSRKRRPDACETPSLAAIHEYFSTKHTTSAYLIFCDGTSTISIDKDFRKAMLRQSSCFIATTNHDVIEHSEDQKVNGAIPNTTRGVRDVAGLDMFLDESMDRLDCLSARWQKKVEMARSRANRSRSATKSEANIALTLNELVRWIQKYPTTNECTHYSCVLRPEDGTVAWAMVYPITE